MKYVWILTLLATVILISLFFELYLITLFIVAICVVILMQSDCRRQLLIKPTFSAFKKAMPPISATEREALESGTVWWDGQLFSGKPDWDFLLTSARHELTAEEQAFLDGPTEQLCEQLNDWEITHKIHDSRRNSSKIMII